MNTFPEKWNKIASFDFEKCELEQGGYFALLSKLGYGEYQQVANEFLLNSVTL